jgi:hypothetical protein
VACRTGHTLLLLLLCFKLLHALVELCQLVLVLLALLPVRMLHGPAGNGCIHRHCISIRNMMRTMQ